MINVPSCDRPRKPGLYICSRGIPKYNGTYTLADIREEDGELWFYGGITVIPLANLEDTALFWGPVRPLPRRDTTQQ